jgi:hypothetical protein
MAPNLLRAALSQFRKILHRRKADGGHWDFFIDAGLRAAHEIRKILKIDELGFVHVAGQAHADSRAYFLYAALDEVEKAALHLMQLRDSKVDQTPKTTGDRITRNVTEFVIEDEGARERRLLETALAVVLSFQTNEQAYYRHLLAVEHLHDLIRMNEDLLEFHGAKSLNTSAAIQRQVEECSRAQAGVDWSRVWYLNSSAQELPEGDSASDEKVLLRYTKPSSIRMRYMRAANALTANERLAIGMSYSEAYGDPSRAVHFAANNMSILRNPEAAVSGVSRIGLLMMVIIDRCHGLIGNPELKLASQLNRVFASNPYAEERVRALSLGDVEVGDFVLASGYLAEILEMKQSRYGNRSFRIRFLAERPLLDVNEDWFAARHVRRLYSRKVLVEKLKEDRRGLPTEIVNAIDDAPVHVVQEALRHAMIATWNGGLREAMQQPRPKQAGNRMPPR